jgi:hypothetical protein
MSARPVVAWVAIASIACTSSPSMGSDPVNLRNAPLEWRAAGRRYTLEAEGWRSFQPIQRQEAGDPLIVVLRLHADSPIPATASVIGIQLLRGETVWSVNGGYEARPWEGANTIEYVVRDGPGGWVAGDSVDVIASVHDGGVTSLVRAPSFVIARVD